MSIFWRVLLAFSISMNLAGAGMVTHHRLSSCGGDCGDCPWERMAEGLPEEAGAAPDLEDMRRSFHSFQKGCRCEMSELRARLLNELLADPVDEEAVEAVLVAMGEAQVDLQRRLIEQLMAERRVLSPEAREVFDERLQGRLLATPMACPGRSPHH